MRLQRPADRDLLRRCPRRGGPFLDEIRAIQAGGGFGSIVGRNAFQRSKADALSLLGTITDIYAGG